MDSTRTTAFHELVDSFFGIREATDKLLMQSLHTRWNLLIETTRKAEHDHHEADSARKAAELASMDAFRKAYDLQQRLTETEHQLESLRDVHSHCLDERNWLRMQLQQRTTGLDGD